MRADKQKTDILRMEISKHGCMPWTADLSTIFNAHLFVVDIFRKLKGTLLQLSLITNGYMRVYGTTR